MAEGDDQIVFVRCVCGRDANPDWPTPWRNPERGTLEALRIRGWQIVFSGGYVQDILCPTCKKNMLTPG